MYTLKDARSEVADVIVPGGTCASGGFVDQRINSALRRLMIASDAPETVGILRISTDKDYITLPRGVKAARATNVFKTPTPLWHYSYSFSPATPGELENSYAPISLESMPGFFPTAFEHVPGMALMAFASSISDASKSIQVYGRKEGGEELVGGYPLRIRRWKDGVEGEVQLVGRDFPSPEKDNPVLSEITGITLPTGLVGYVTLLAVNPATWSMYFLSKYHPDEIKPGYRRYHMRNLGCCPCDSGCCRCVTFMTKLDFTPLTRDDDPLPVQSLDAVKFMVMAIAEENQRNPQTAGLYTQQAMSALNAHLRDARDGEQMVLTINDDFGMSGVGGMYFG